MQSREGEGGGRERRGREEGGDGEGKGVGRDGEGKGVGGEGEERIMNKKSIENFSLSFSRSEVRNLEKKCHMFVEEFNSSVGIVKKANNAR